MISKGQRFSQLVSDIWYPDTKRCTTPSSAIGRTHLTARPDLKNDRKHSVGKVWKAEEGTLRIGIPESCMFSWRGYPVKPGPISTDNLCPTAVNLCSAPARKLHAVFGARSPAAHRHSEAHVRTTFPLLPSSRPKSTEPGCRARPVHKIASTAKKGVRVQHLLGACGAKR